MTEGVLGILHPAPVLGFFSLLRFAYMSYSLNSLKGVI